MISNRQRSLRRRLQPILLTLRIAWGTPISCFCRIGQELTVRTVRTEEGHGRVTHTLSW